MFEYINIVAILGTTCFMTAVAMVWYSPYLFQKQWLAAVRLTQADIEASPQKNQIRFIVTIGTYAVVIYLIALLIGYAQVFSVPVQNIALLLSVGFASMIAGFTVWEQRSWVYYAITVSFSTTFICGSVFLLYYWPW